MQHSESAADTGRSFKIDVAAGFTCSFAPSTAGLSVRASKQWLLEVVAGKLASSGASSPLNLQQRLPAGHMQCHMSIVCCCVLCA